MNPTKQDLITHKRKLANLVLLHETAKLSRKKEATAYAKEEQAIKDKTEAQTIVQTIALSVQKEAHLRISEVVSRCLSAVFDNAYEFQIQFNRKRNKTEAVLSFRRDGQDVDPLTASGGGPVDVASFALRLSCLLLSQPPLSKILILDEPFKFVSVADRQRLRELLEGLSKDTGVQFIIITHMEELEFGHIVRL